jgi:hypothetical protein
MFQFVNKYFDRLKTLFYKEVELVKLKALRGLADFFSHAFLLIFITIFINTLIIVGSIWLGFVLGEIFDSMTIGFGLITLLIFLIFILIIIFRKAFIINPFRNGMMAFYLSTEEAKAKNNAATEIIEPSDKTKA